MRLFSILPNNNLVVLCLLYVPYLNCILMWQHQGSNKRRRVEPQEPWDDREELHENSWLDMTQQQSSSYLQEHPHFREWIPSDSTAQNETGLGNATASHTTMLLPQTFVQTYPQVLLPQNLDRTIASNQISDFLQSQPCLFGEELDTSYSHTCNDNWTQKSSAPNFLPDAQSNNLSLDCFDVVDNHKTRGEPACQSNLSQQHNSGHQEEPCRKDNELKEEDIVCFGMVSSATIVQIIPMRYKETDQGDTCITWHIRK